MADDSPSSRALLERTRDRLREAITDKQTSPSALAGLSRELRAVLADLAAMDDDDPSPDPPAAGSVEAIKGGRDDRRSGAADSSSPSRRSQPRRRGRSPGAG